jgi:hypothetical protein
MTNLRYIKVPINQNDYKTYKIVANSIKAEDIGYNATNLPQKEKIS